MSVENRHPLVGLADEVIRLHGRLAAVNGDRGETGGLTGAQALVLTAVINAERPPTVPQIGRSLGHARQSVQRIANVLIAQGLVTSEENPDHKRAPLLLPTEAGRAVHGRLQDRAQVWIARITEGIDAGDIIAATKTLRTLRERLEADPATARGRH